MLDEEGYLFLTGRLKEQINRGGEKISPVEVDEVLLRHPAVAEAVTFAIPHDKLGEEVGAAVVLVEGHDVSERELRDLPRATSSPRSRCPSRSSSWPRSPRAPPARSNASASPRASSSDPIPAGAGPARRILDAGVVTRYSRSRLCAGGTPVRVRDSGCGR